MKCRFYLSNFLVKFSKMIFCRLKLNLFIRLCLLIFLIDFLVSIGLFGVCCIWKYLVIRLVFGRMLLYNEGVIGGVDDNDDEDDEEDVDNGVGDVDEDGIMNEVGNDVDCSIGIFVFIIGVFYWFFIFIVLFLK